MHDDDDKPAGMGPRARRCRDFCGGWRDPDTYGTAGGFHFNVTAVAMPVGGRTRVCGYWCAGGFDPLEPLVVAVPGGRRGPVIVVSLEPPPDPWVAKSRPHLRWISVDSRGTVITVGSRASSLNSTRTADTNSPRMIRYEQRRRSRVTRKRMDPLEGGGRRQSLWHHDEVRDSGEDAIGGHDCSVDVQGGGGDPQVIAVKPVCQRMTELSTHCAYLSDPREQSVGYPARLSMSRWRPQPDAVAACPTRRRWLRNGVRRPSRPRGRVGCCAGRRDEVQTTVDAAG